MVRGSINQLLCKFLNILATKEELVLTDSISALITTLISLHCSLLLTTRLSSGVQEECFIHLCLPDALDRDG